MDIEVSDRDLESVEQATEAQLGPGARSAVEPCKKCGCAHMILDRVLPPQWNKVVMVFYCRHCLKKHRETVKIKVCPECQDDDTSVLARRVGFRRMVCNACDARFKIVD